MSIVSVPSARVSDAVGSPAFGAVAVGGAFGAGVGVDAGGCDVVGVGVVVGADVCAGVAVAV
jgi:hypothetical protein